MNYKYKARLVINQEQLQISAYFMTRDGAEAEVRQIVGAIDGGATGWRLLVTPGATYDICLNKVQSFIVEDLDEIGVATREMLQRQNELQQPQVAAQYPAYNQGQRRL